MHRMRIAFDPLCLGICVHTKAAVEYERHDIMAGQINAETPRGQRWAAAWRQIVVVMAMCAALPVLAAAQASRTTEPPDMSSVVATLVEAHNRVRAQHDLSPLQPQAKLMAAAQVQARYMAEREKTTHRGRGGSTLAQRVENQGYTYLKIAENVASGQATPEEALASWMDSPSHRQNILDDFAEIGAARVIGDDQRPYWCVVFGTPMPDFDPQQASATLVTMLNQERMEADFAPLQVAPKLANVAAARARAMATHNTLQPQAGGGTDLPEQLAQEGYPYQQVSHAVASGVPTPADVIQTLMASESYTDQVLGSFTDIGVGYATATDGTPYWSLIFGLPRP